MTSNKKFLRWIELLVLFFVAPLLLWIFREDLKGIQAGGSMIIFALPFVSLLLIIFLKFKFHYTLKRLFILNNFWKNVISILIFFIPSAIFYSILSWKFLPEYFLQLPKENPNLWLTIMLAYPIFSVLPQGIIYRVYFFERFKFLFSKPWQMIVVAGMFFCFAHILFNNFVALIFTLIGGLLFAWRYQKTDSWLISSLEHALYGNLLFTIGIGRFLVAGLN